MEKKTNKKINFLRTNDFNQLMLPDNHFMDPLNLNIFKLFYL